MGSVSWKLCGTCGGFYDSKTGGRVAGKPDEDLLILIKRGIVNPNKIPCGRCDSEYWYERRDRVFRRYERWLSGRLERSEEQDTEIN